MLENSNLQNSNYFEILRVNTLHIIPKSSVRYASPGILELIYNKQDKYKTKFDWSDLRVEWKDFKLRQICNFNTISSEHTKTNVLFMEINKPFVVDNIVINCNSTNQPY